MTAERYVLLGLAPARSPWFEAVSQWTMSASIAAEFVKCVSSEEVRARLASGRRHSALIVDAGSPYLDRDLVDAASAAATPVLVVRDPRSPAFSRRDLGVAAELPAEFGPETLLDVLATHSVPVGRGAVLPPLLDEEPTPLWLAQLVAVAGPGGTGTSTLAMAVAQGLSADARYGRRVLLADLARRADQAMLHFSPELGPGVQELVEAHRLGRPAPEEIVRMTFDVPRRGYRLLLGLRQPEAWAALRPRAVDAAVTGLRRSFQAVVADLTGDFEGEVEGGSAEVEERNHLARTVAGQATVVVLVGRPGLQGVHALARQIREVLRMGVDPGRVIPVHNQSPRHPATRAASSRALAALLEELPPLAVANPVAVPERKLEPALRDGTPLPDPVVSAVTGAVTSVIDRLADTAPPETAPARIVPGSLGSWSDPEVETGNA